jgi:hypothetical protein
MTKYLIPVQTLPQRSLGWMSPTKFALAGLAIAIGYSIYQYDRTPRVAIASYYDVSDSASPYQKAVEQICTAIEDRAIDGDLKIEAAFADRVMVNSNAVHEEKQSGANCKGLSKKPNGIGKQPGTDILAALNSMDGQIQHQRSQGNKQPAVGFLVIQAAEPKTGHLPANSKMIKKSIDKITKEGYLVIIGPEAMLQGQLNQEIVKNGKVKICAFDLATACGVNWAFDRARK